MIRVLCLLGPTATTVAFASPSALAAQEPLLTYGAHVRISTSTPRLARRTGYVVQLSRDSLWVLPDGSHERLGIADTAVTALDVVVGRGSRGVHTIVGGYLGFLGGAAIGVIAGNSCPTCWDKFEADALAGGAVGLLIGTTVGRGLPAEHWVSVEPPGGLQGAGRPATVGIRFTLHFRV